MKIHLKKLAPTSREILLCSVSALFVGLLGNMVQLYNYYTHGISPFNMHANAYSMATSVAARIDSFRPSATIITFLIWAFAGLLVLALIQGAHHALTRVAYLQFISSKRFKRPANFSLSAFWKQIALTSVGSMAAFCVAAFLVSLFILCFLPVGLAYSHVFLFVPSLLTMFYGLMGITMVFTGLVLLTLAVRLIYHRRRLLRLT